MKLRPVNHCPLTVYQEPIRTESFFGCRVHSPFPCQRICAADAVSSMKSLAEGFIQSDTFIFFQLCFSKVCVISQNLSRTSHLVTSQRQTEYASSLTS